MTHETLPDPFLAPALDGIDSALGRVHSECQDYSGLVEELFDQLDRLRNELELQAQELAGERRQLAARESQISSQRDDAARMARRLEIQEAQLESALEEVKGLRSDVNARSAGDGQALVEQIMQAEASQEALRGELTRALSELQNLHGVANELAAARQELAEMRRELSDRNADGERAADRRSDEQAARLTELRDEIRQLEKALQQRDLEHAAAEERWELALEQAVQDRDLLRRRLQASESELAQLAEIALELSETRRELNALQQWIQTSNNDRGYVEEDAVRIAALEQERTSLEAELELVRGRSAELYGAVTEQKRELARQRTEVAGELRHLRTLIESRPAAARAAEGASDRSATDRAATDRVHSERANSERAAADDSLADKQVAETGAATVGASSGDSASGDPVVSSVMAQFARLQREVASRRKPR